MNQLIVLCFSFVLLTGCVASRGFQINVENEEVLREHLANIKDDTEFSDLYKDFTYQNKIYAVNEYYLSKEELQSTMFSDLIKARNGEVVGPIQTSDSDCILIKKQSSSEHNYSRLRLIFRESVLTNVAREIVPTSVVKTKIEQGQDFEELARTYSEDYTAAENGGCYGWSIESALKPEIFEASRFAKKGEIKYAQTNMGLFIIKVEEAWRIGKLTKVIELKIKGCD